MRALRELTLEKSLKMGELKEELAKVLVAEQTLLSGTQYLYNKYKKDLCGKPFSTPLPEEVLFCPDNFPYLIHLQVMDSATGKFIEAKAKKVVPLLEKGAFDDTEYCYGDPRRARELFNLPNLLLSPDYIYPNARHGSKRNCGDVRGEHIYVIQSRNAKQLKVGLTLFDKRLGKSILVSSFFTNWNWINRCIGGAPCKYDKNATEKKDK
jgi:hypothetical protein